MIGTHYTCRACTARLEPLLDLGSVCRSDFPRPEEPDLPPASLAVDICAACHLVPLRETHHPARIFQQQYWYRSGVNEVMRYELIDVVDRATIHVHGAAFTGDAVVLDTGANDGTLLAAYESYDPRVRPLRIAFEPSTSFYPQLRPHAEILHANFFPSADSEKVDFPITILTSIAMFYDVEEPLKFVWEVDRLLAPDGVWVVQFQDLAQQVAATAYDNFTFEHLMYYSLGTFEQLLQGFDLHVTRVETRMINGGSLRIFVQRKALPVDPSVAYQREWEQPFLTFEAFERFAWRIDQHRSQLQALITRWAERGPVDLYAASTKSSTLLQYCGLDSTIIRQAVERSPEKWGRVMSGTRIPIVAEDVWREDPAPTTLVGAWQFRRAFLAREAAYLAEGGMFLVPLPSVDLVAMPTLHGV